MHSVDVCLHKHILGVAPSQQQWQIKVYRIFYLKMLIILLVTGILGRGHTHICVYMFIYIYKLIVHIILHFFCASPFQTTEVKMVFFKPHFLFVSVFFGCRLLVDAFKNSVEALPVLVACSS